MRVPDPHGGAALNKTVTLEAPVLPPGHLWEEDIRDAEPRSRDRAPCLTSTAAALTAEDMRGGYR